MKMSHSNPISLPGTRLDPRDVPAQQIQSVHEELRVKEILESTTDGVILLDAEWQITYLNQPAQDMVSNGRALIGIHLWAAFPHAMNEKMVSQYSKSQEDRVIVDYDELYPEAGEKWLHIRAFPTAEGTTAIFFQDITGRRRAEKAQRDNEKLVVVGRLAASIAHEINNPLESVANLLHLLQCEAGMSQTALHYIDLAQQELHRVALITVDTLQFFRQTAGASQASVADILKSVLTLFQGQIRQSSVSIVTRYADHAEYTCFPAELRQVFANFIGNALDATGVGDRISIRVRPMSDAVFGETGILVTIADTGTGMSAHTLAHIYEAFFTTKETTGTGLGLWISGELIHKHRGRICVRSRQASGNPPQCSSDQASQRSGTVFEIFLPRENSLASLLPALGVTDPAQAA